jgi:DNA mismatch repair protein MutL
MTSRVVPAPHAQGTTVEVRDLFFNTPARRKFLRTEKTELGRIDDIVRKMSLSHPQIAFLGFPQWKILPAVPSGGGQR